MNVNRFIILVAVVVFIIAAVLAFLTSTDVETILGLIAVGGACYAGSALA